MIITTWFYLLLLNIPLMEIVND